MPLLATDAVVLHVFDYMETSRILRLVTREAGVQSALAKGARRAGRRYGSALDLFAEGAAQLYTKEGRDLHTMSAFDVTRARPELAEDMGRFTGAAALAELTLRFTQRDDSHPSLYDVVVGALDALGRAPAGRTREAAIAGAWHIVGELGFAPETDACSSCRTPIAPDAPAMFSHPAGGVLCARCSRLVPTSRTVPAAARAALRAWLAGADAPEPLADAAEGKAHQRLLREFLSEHLTDGRPLRAFEVWENGGWDG
ncbi:MAG TPA: DNA repair protein RecO [Gemmatimonadaceae bacterium]|nr:DNA repair protein RecO [Gemmatimonadaceae bacterium]